MSNRIVPLIVATISLALSGCFISEQPKFSLDSAAPAFGEGGRYEVLERQSDGSYRHQEVFVVRHLPDRSYEFVNEKNEVLPISFHEMARGLYVGQARPDKNKPGYGYVVLQMDEGEGLIYAPQCDNQDPTRLKEFNVALKDKYNCLIDRVTDPIALFATLKLGEPVSKMVPQ